MHNVIRRFGPYSLSMPTHAEPIPSGSMNPSERVLPETMDSASECPMRIALTVTLLAVEHGVAD